MEHLTISCQAAGDFASALIGAMPAVHGNHGTSHETGFVGRQEQGEIDDF
jgi:hypothetical protein